MALRNPPSWLQNGSHPAENDRNTTTQAIWNGPGICDYGDFQVTPTGTPSMAVQVASGRAIVSGSQTTTQGNYVIFNDATATVSIATASPTLPRIDLICLVVQDSYYSGANNQVIFQAVTGTPNASPVAPTAPANSLILAQIAVAANATAINTGNITDKRSLATFSDTVTTASVIGANSLTVNTIASQTGKAILVNNSSGTQVFAVSPAGAVTFPDGSTQTTAATYNPNLTINTQTGTTYTILAGDAQKLVTLANSSPVTVTIASNATQALPVGTQITLSQYDVGQVNIVGASTPNPVTIVSNGATANNPKLRAKYSTCTLIQTTTDNWLVVGDIS